MGTSSSILSLSSFSVHEYWKDHLDFKLHIQNGYHRIVHHDSTCLTSPQLLFFLFPPGPSLLLNRFIEITNVEITGEWNLNKVYTFYYLLFQLQENKKQFLWFLYQLYDIEDTQILTLSVLERFLFLIYGKKYKVNILDALEKVRDMVRYRKGLNSCGVNDDMIELEGV